MVTSVDLTLTNLVLLCATVFIVKKLIKVFRKWNIERIQKKWDNSPTGKVIVHSIWRGKTVPSASPFALKLETYLRMAKIPYELDITDMWGPKGKLPWISYNGSHVGDSHLCIQFLNKKLSIDLNKNVDEKQLAIAKACRVVLEEYVFWGTVQYKLIDVPSSLSKIMNFPSNLFTLLLPLQKYFMTQRMMAQGLGVHSSVDVYSMTEDCLRAVSKILGNKKFITGNEPVEDDAGVFGVVAQAVYAIPGSGFETLVHGELSNLKEYCERMKQLYWPDWEQCLDKP